MMERQVNYDEVAATYDDRYASGVAEARHTIPAALRQLLRPDVASQVLEVGCGTGFWLSAFSAGNEVYGLDASPVMLARARQRHDAVVCGTADQLPFPSGVFDLVYCVNAFHHFSDKPIFIREARRVLRSGGVLAVIGMDPHGQRDQWYIYDYFEGTYEADLRRFPSVPQIINWIRAVGFSELRHCVVERILNHQCGRAVLSHSVLQKNGTSQLILLSDEAYAAGLDRLNGDLVEAEARGEVLMFPEDISLVMVVGRASGAQK